MLAPAWCRLQVLRGAEPGENARLVVGGDPVEEALGLRLAGAVYCTIPPLVARASGLAATRRDGIQLRQSGSFADWSPNVEILGNTRGSVAARPWPNAGSDLGVLRAHAPAA